MVTQIISEWRVKWGTPPGIVGEPEGRKLEIAFILAILFHALPFGYLWKHQITITEKTIETITLQSVDLIEPEEPKPAVVVEVQKPRSALEFLKMALPMFSKPSAIEAPKEIVVAPKIQEPKIAEPALLIEKKMQMKPAGPEIKLDMSRAGPGPAIEGISKLMPAEKAAVPKNAEPALKLEEVGKRAVAPQTLAPAISLNQPRGKAVDGAALPQIGRVVPAKSASVEKLAERTAPSAAPAASVQKVLGYGKAKSEEQVYLERPAQPVKAAPQVVQPVSAQKPKRSAQTLEISKEKVKITGPLSARKVVKSVIPDYPVWARARNIETEVVIYFTVSAAGNVRTNLLIARTSGYPEMDRLASEALKQWKFTPLSGDTQDQWGEITFKFLLD